MNHISRAIYYISKSGNFNSECDFAIPIKHQFDFCWPSFFPKVRFILAFKYYLKSPDTVIGLDGVGVS